MNFLSGIKNFFKGRVLVATILLLVTIVLYFSTKDLLRKTIEHLLPGEFVGITINLIYGLLALSFVLSIFSKLMG